MDLDWPMGLLTYFPLKVLLFYTGVMGINDEVIVKDIRGWGVGYLRLRSTHIGIVHSGGSENKRSWVPP